MPRVVFEQLSTQLGQPIVVENRGGAGGTIGMDAAKKMPADEARSTGERYERPGR